MRALLSPIYKKRPSPRNKTRESDGVVVQPRYEAPDCNISPIVFCSLFMERIKQRQGILIRLDVSYRQLASTLAASNVCPVLEMAKSSNSMRCLVARLSVLSINYKPVYDRADRILGFLEFMFVT